jgi:hypothetical protein
VHYQETNKSHQIPRIDYEKQFIPSPSLHETMIMLTFSIIGLNQAHQHYHHQPNFITNDDEKELLTRLSSQHPVIYQHQLIDIG